MSIKQTSNDSLSVIKNWNSHAEALGVGGVLCSMWKTDLSNAGRPFPANEHMLDESANILSLCQGYWINIPRILQGISGRIFGRTLKQTLIRSLNFLGCLHVLKPQHSSILQIARPFFYVNRWKDVQKIRVETCGLANYSAHSGKVK